MPANGTFRKPFTSMFGIFYVFNFSISEYDAIWFQPIAQTNNPIFFIYIYRLSLKYHPDKNKGKGAQEKFEEINNGKNLNFDFSIPI
jgi:hypothetical protein